MYRNRFDQYDQSQYDDSDVESCPKESYKGEHLAEIAFDLAITKARRTGRVEPIRVYECDNPAAACFMRWHLTSTELR